MNTSNAITYSCTALVGSNKAGVLKKNEEGYYPMVVGALNVENNCGDYYPLAAGRDVIEKCPEFLRRIRAGQCRSELGHPKKLPGMTNDEFIARNLYIDPANVSSHFEKVWLLAGVADNSGNGTVLTMANVCPSGPHGPALEKQILNPKENVAFSIRCFSEDIFMGFKKVKHIRKIVCYDQVNEPGVALATKYNAPTLEHLSDVLITPEIVREILANRNKMDNMGLEHDIIVEARHLEQVLGVARGTIAAKPSRVFRSW